MSSYKFRRVGHLKKLTCKFSSQFSIHFLRYKLEEFRKNQNILSSMIIPFILITCKFDQMVTLSPEGEGVLKKSYMGRLHPEEGKELFYIPFIGNGIPFTYLQ